MRLKGYKIMQHLLIFNQKLIGILANSFTKLGRTQANKPLKFFLIIRRHSCTQSNWRSHKQILALKMEYHSKLEEYQVHPKEHPPIVSRYKTKNPKALGIDWTLWNLSWTHTSCLIIIPRIYNLRQGETFLECSLDVEALRAYSLSLGRPWPLFHSRIKTLI